MKKIKLLAVFLLSSRAVLHAQECFVGKWADERNSQVIAIYLDNSHYYGKLIYRKDTVPKSSYFEIELFDIMNYF